MATKKSPKAQSRVKKAAARKEAVTVVRNSPAAQAVVLKQLTAVVEQAPPHPELTGKVRGTTVAPHKLHTHAPAPEAAKAGARLSSETRKVVETADKDKLRDAMLAHEVSPSEVPLASLASLSAEVLHKVATSYGKGKGAKYSGHSTLGKDELVAYLHTGVMPEPKAGTTRALKEEAKELKESGLIVGAISSLKTADLRTAVATAQAGTPVTVSKTKATGTLKHGTADWCKELLRQGQTKGFPESVTAKSKSMFGATVSTLKVAQLNALVQALGLAN